MRVGELLAVGDEHRGRERVVLGLADEVGRDVVGVGGVVGEHGDLGGSGLGVDADEALEQALGGDDPDVARAGDERDGVAHDGLTVDETVVVVDEAVGEHRDRLGAADRIHLLDTEQRARREDGRVGVAGEDAGVLALRRRGHRERARPRRAGPARRS